MPHIAVQCALKGVERERRERFEREKGSSRCSALRPGKKVDFKDERDEI